MNTLLLGSRLIRAVVGGGIVLSLMVLSLPGQARDIRSVRPDREGFSAERLAKIDAYMNGQVEAGVMAGGLGLIARNGNIVYSSNWGDSDREANKAISIR